MSSASSVPVRSDDGLISPINFESLAMLDEFLAAMQPHDVFGHPLAGNSFEAVGRADGDAVH